MTLLHKILIGSILIIGGLLASVRTQAQTTGSFQDTIVFENGVVWLCNVVSLSSNSIQIEKAPQYGQGLYWANFNNIRGLRGPTARKVLPPDMYQAISSYANFYSASGYYGTSNRIGSGALNNGNTNYLPAEAPLTSKHMAYNAIYTPLASEEHDGWKRLENSMDISVGTSLPFWTNSELNEDLLKSSDLSLSNAYTGIFNLRTKVHKRWQLLLTGGLSGPTFSPNITPSSTDPFGYPPSTYEGRIFIAHASAGPAYRVFEHRLMNINVFATVGYVHHYMSLERNNSPYRGGSSSGRSLISSTGANSTCYRLGANFQLMIPNQNGWYLSGEASYYYSNPKFNLTINDPGNRVVRSGTIDKGISQINLSFGFGLYF